MSTLRAPAAAATPCPPVPRLPRPVCAEAIADPASRNRRNNPSALLTFSAHPDGRPRNVLIDVGKTFRDAVQRCLPALGVARLDAVLLTHGHADAMMGLDDLRDVAPGHTLPVYLSRGCFDVVARAFPYLVTRPATKGLFVASLDFRIIEPWVPFEVEGLVVVPVPVDHGPPVPTLGFEFRCVAQRGAGGASGGGSDGGSDGGPVADGAGADCAVGGRAAREPAAAAAADTAAGDDRVVYLSDVAALPPDTRAFLLAGPRPALLVLDALSYKSYPTHFGFKQAVACALDIRAARTVFVGMNHRVDFHPENAKLAAFATARGADALELGFDGWCAGVALTRRAALGDVAAEVAAGRAASPPPPSEELGGGGCGGESVSYAAAALSEWEDGQSPSASANHAVPVHAT